MLVEDAVVPEWLVARRGRDPYPYYAWLREHAPVHRQPGRSGTPLWHVTRYDDVRAFLADPRLSKDPDRVPGYVPGPFGLNKHLVHVDPPEHTRLRGLVNAAFLPRRIAALEPFVRSTAGALLDRIDLDAGADLIADFALPLTFTLICRILGVPEHFDTPRARALLLTTVTPGGVPAEERDRELHEYLTELVGHKRSVPSDDLLGALVSADGGLSEEELVSTAYLLLLVGHDTTVGLIGNGTLALLQHPGQLARLRADETLTPTAIEELARFDAPVRDATFRAAREHIELHGRVIRPGEIVSLVIGSANRDDRKFTDANRLDLGRTPNEHIAFGRGPHFCVGAALVRMEAAIAFRMLLERLGEFRLAVPASTLTWRPSRVMRSLETLPVRRG